MIELALDSRENAQYRNPDELYRYLTGRITDEGTYYVLLDEVQYAISDDELRGKNSGPLAIYDVLNGLLHHRNVDVYVTGSNSRFLSKDVMTEFSGRGDEVHVTPLSFSEFMQVFDGDVYHGWSEYVLYGGMPLLRSFGTDEQKASYLSRLFDEVYLTDVIARNRVSKTQELEDVIEVGFVANREFRRYYIQSAFAMDTDEKRRQEKESPRRIDDSFRKIVVVKDVVKPYMDNDGILTMGLLDFLVDANSLDM